MKRLLRLALGAILTSASAACAQGLTDAQARTTIAPWYSLFNVASRGDVKAIQEQVLTPTMSCARAIFPANAGAVIRRSRWSAILPIPSPT